jgi:MFS family permease
VLATYGRIASNFNALENASWLATSYVLAMSIAMPMYGKLSDIFGRSLLLIISSTIFALGK